MKYAINFLTLFLTLTALNAQITITENSFPKVGDTLYTAIDNLPTGMAITSPGEDQRWDLSILQSPFTRSTIVRSTYTGSGAEGFPNADFIIAQTDAVEAYFKEQNGQLQLIGLFGQDPIGIGAEVLTRFTPPIVERRAPLRYLDTHESESNVSVAFSTDDLPRQILDQLPITPDSLRIRIQFERFDIVDAWGQMIIPGGIYDVIREKRIETRHTRLDAKLGFLPWQDITDLVPNNELLGDLNTVSYYYLSDESKEPIAIIYLDETEEQILRVEYKSNDLTTDVQNIGNLKPGVYAYPNPAIVNVRFEFSNLRAGNYTLTIYNILGVEMRQESYFIDGSHIEKVNISNLRKGTYLYSLKDENGKTLTTKRLLVIKP